MYVINYLVMSMREHMHDLRMRWLAEHAGTLGPSVHRVRLFTLITTQCYLLYSALACVIYCKLYAANSRSH